MTKRNLFSLTTERENKSNNAVKSGKYLNKKGSSLILTLVVIAMITILSTLVVSLALNAYRTSVQNRWADEDFFYCEECLDDVYGTVVATTNDIFIDNYKRVLGLFTTTTPDIVNKTFREGIRIDLRSNETNQAGDLYKALNKTVDALDDEGNSIGELRVSYDSSRYDGNTDLLLEDFRNGRYVFKDVEVEYWNKSRTAEGENQLKFFSSVTTDIVVYIPDLIPEQKEDDQGALSYVLISGGDMSISGSPFVSGNIYAGNNLSFNSGSNAELLSDYITVCNQINNKGKFSATGFSTTANIWCKDLILDASGASIAVSGNLFVNDDLEINGSNCTVQLAGKYYGYGDGTTLTQNVTSKGGSGTTMDSAILVNGKGTILDMMSIEELVINGHSFFPVEGTNNYNASESLATIVSQSIYMVNNKYIDFANRRVIIDDISIGFENIKTSDNKSLIDILGSGYTLLTGGVDLSIANVNVDGSRITEEVFADEYVSSSAMVTLGTYQTGTDKYCSLYWNFKGGFDIKKSGADLVHSSYITDLGAERRVGIADVYLKDIYLYKDGLPFTIDGNKISVNQIFDASITDQYEYLHSFDIQYGNVLPSGVSTGTFKSDYLVSSEPVRAVVVETQSDSEGAYTYKVYLQWNFDALKVATQNKGDLFISACIEAGLIDGFLEKFMDGGYIKIAPSASLSSTADLYEYIVGENGYHAQKYGWNSNSLYGSSAYSKNFSNTYKWYMTTLTPRKYNPFDILYDFDDNAFSSGEAYSIFNRNSYYYNSSNIRQDSNYLNLETIDNNGVQNHEIVASADMKYKNLIINGDLIIEGYRWTVNGTTISPFTEGIIFIDGNVKINSPDMRFNGLIIANGTVEINGGRYTYDERIVEGCLETLKSNSNWMSIVSDEFYKRKSDSTVGTSSLNAMDCIKYENWTRNRDQ